MAEIIDFPGASTAAPQFRAPTPRELMEIAAILERMRANLITLQNGLAFRRANLGNELEALTR